MYISRVKGSNPEKGVAPSLQLSVVAIEKGALWSPSTKIANLPFFTMPPFQILI